MKKSMKKILVVLLVVAISISVLGCVKTEEGKLRALMDQLETSCNAMDVYGVLDCLDPILADQVEVVLELAGSLAGVDAESFLDFTALFLNIASFTGELDSLPVYEIKVENIEFVDDASAVVETEFSIDINGDVSSYPISFYCTSDGDRWYIKELAE